MKATNSRNNRSQMVGFVLLTAFFVIWNDETVRTRMSTNALLLVSPTTKTTSSSPSSSSSSSSWTTIAPSSLSPAVTSSSPPPSPPFTAFVIERLSAHAPPHVFQDIAKMCINVFFNQGRGPGVYIPPWQQMQLTYLQHMQAADLQQRRYSQQQHQQQQQQQVEQFQDDRLFQDLLTGTTSATTSAAASTFENDLYHYHHRHNGHHHEQQQQQQQRHVEYNDMFVAYQVLPAEPYTAKKKPLLLDLAQVYNIPSTLQQQQQQQQQQYGDNDYYDFEGVDYVRGELLGFCEVTERNFGLDQQNHHQRRRRQQQQQHYYYQNVYYNDEQQQQQQQQQPQFLIPPLYAAQVRPVLTNLAVKPKARQYGIGSALVQACEEAVLERGRFDEIVLEAEAENTKALAFYQKRGYHMLYQDPACRRYDVEGWMLRKVPCTRIVMRKCLYHRQEEEEETKQVDRDYYGASSSSSSYGRRTVGLVSTMWQRLKDKSLSYIQA